MYTCICTYVYLYAHMYIWMYDMREHCLPLCWPLLGVEVKHYWLSFAYVLLSFVQIRSVNDQNSDLAHTVCACVRVWDVWVWGKVVCVRAQVKLSMHGNVLAARYGLCRPFLGEECTSNSFTPYVNTSHLQLTYYVHIHWTPRALPP